MLDSVYLGEVPADEPCSSNEERTNSRKECEILRNQIRRICGKEVGSAQLKIKDNPHDLGSYFSLECYYSDQDEEGIEYAFKCESEYPEKWDAIAEEELKEAGIDISSMRRKQKEEAEKSKIGSYWE